MPTLSRYFGRTDPAAPCHRILKSLTSLALTLILGSTCAYAAAQTRSTDDYDYYLTGSAEDALPASMPPANAVVLMGGDTDVKDAFRWMIGKAGGGNFLVLRASGADGYNDWIYKDIGGVSSVESLVIKTSAGASDSFVLDRVKRAEAIFIAGGDQWDYVSLWKGTPLAKAINEAVAERRVPVGGTSAGLMILGQFVFTAKYGTVTSAQALANPYDRLVQLDQDILTIPFLARTIGDSHIYKRDRMGRLLTFMARNIMDTAELRKDPTAARAIGVEAKTALLIDNGMGSIVGAGAVYLLRPYAGSVPMRCSSTNASLTFRNVQVHRITEKTDLFDLGSWTARTNSIAMYDISAECGTLISSQSGGRIY